MDDELVGRAMHSYGDAVNLGEPLRIRFWHDRGLTIAQVGLLFLLHQRDGQSVGELAEGLYARPATVTGLADRLERGGFIVRRGDEVDRRVVRVSLTDEGYRVLDEVRAESRSYLRRAFEMMGEARVSALADLLRQLVEAAASVAEEASEDEASLSASVGAVPEGRLCIAE